MKRSDITALFPDATKEQIDQLLNINGADIESAKAPIADLQQQLDDAKALAKSLEKRPTADDLSALQAELDGLKASNAARDMRAKVSKETGVPAELLTGDDEESCTAQAQMILEYAKPGSYPAVKDGGEPQNPPKNSVDAAWTTLAADLSN